LQASRAWKRVRHRLEFLGVKIILLLTRLLPLSWLRALGAALGWTAFRILGVRRKVSVENVRRSLGDSLGPGEAEGIALRSYQNFGRSLVEFASFGSLAREDVLAMIEFQGLENFDAALAAGRGAIPFAGHFDNWELFGAGAAALGYPINFLVGEQSNKLVDDLMNKLRRSQGIGIITRQAALRKVLRALESNQFVAMLADQDARRSGVFVDFFGRPASTFKGPATFALKQGCPIISGFMVRRPGLRHLAIVEKPIHPPEGLGKDEAVKRMTQEYTSLLEEYVKRHPDHYFWAHRRWKTTPPQ